MVSKIVFVLAFVAAVALAQPDGPPSYGYNQQDSYNAPAKYDFDWSVKDDYSNNDFGQTESRDGDDTQGSYYVLLPDGRRQTVTYYVNGDSGFVAEVSYEGEAKYPDSNEQQRYRPQPPQQYQPEEPQPPQQYQPQEPEPQQPQYQRPRKQKPRRRQRNRYNN